MNEKYKHNLYGDIEVEKTFYEYGLNLVLFYTKSSLNRADGRYVEDLYTFTLNTEIQKDT